MYCAKNVLLGKKVKQLWGHIMVVVMVCVCFFKEDCPSLSVCFTPAKMSPSKLICFLGLMSIQWMPRLTAESPTFLWGKTTGTYWALQGVLGPPAYHFFLLSPGHDYLVPPMQRGNSAQGAFSPSVQTSVNIYHRAVTWIWSYLSECYSKFSDDCCYSESPASRGEG